MTQKVGGIEFDVDVDASGVKSASSTVQADLKNVESSFNKVDSSTKKFNKTAIKAGKSLGGVGRNAGMAGIQIQQFVGQIQGGQSALLALSQQGADLGFVLGRAGLGAAVGIAATALSFLIPALTGSGSEVSELKDRIKELGEEIKLTTNQIRFLADENDTSMNDMSKANIELADKLKNAREELEKMQTAGTGLDSGQFAIPRSAEENQKRYAVAIEETRKRINALSTEIDINNQEMLKLSRETAGLGKETEETEKNTKDYTTALQAQVIALESGAKAAEVYAAAEAAVANGTTEQLPQIIELINRKYELKAAQEQAAQAARNEAAAMREQESEYQKFLAALEQGEAEKLAREEGATNTLDAFRQSLMSEEQLRAEAYQRELEQFREAAEILGISKDEVRELEKQKAKQHADELLDIEKRRADAEKAIEQKKFKDKLNVASSMFGNLSSLMNTESKKMFEIGKAAATAGAIVDGIAAVQGAYKVGSKIGGPPLGAAFAATAAAATLANIKQIQSTQFGSAGSGQSFQGGQVVNNVSSQQSQPQQRNVSIALTGSSFTGGDIRTLIGQINEELGDGVTLNTTGG
jgi:peroxiredoxin